MLEIELHNTTNHPIPNLADIHTWINAAIKQSGCQIPESQRYIGVQIISAAESADLNQGFRQRSGPTNVLAFNDEAFAGIPADSLGDLALCAELVVSEAQTQHKSQQAHWAHLLIHGTLHLLGFDHLTPQDAKIMESLEIRILQSLDFPNPYIA